MLSAVPAASAADKQDNSASAASEETQRERGKVSESMQEIVKGIDADLKAAGLSGQKLAVMRFTENGVNAKEKELGSAVQAELHTRFAQMGWDMVERERLADLVKEMELSQSGLIEDSKAAEMCEMAGTDMLVLGSVSEVGDRYLVNARAVSREKGVTVSAHQVEVSSAYLIALSSESVVLRTRWDSTYRSMIAPGWGQFYNEQPVKAGVFIGFQLATIGAVLGLHFGSEKVKDDYDNLGPEATQQDFDRKRGLYKDLRDWRNYMIIAVGTVWAINVIDAAVSGKTYTRTETGVVVEGSGDFAPTLLAAPGEKPVPGVNLNFQF